MYTLLEQDEVKDTPNFPYREKDIMMMMMMT